MTDLVEQLRAQAVELRAQAQGELRFGCLTLTADPLGNFDGVRAERDSLADLIDRMCDRHAPATDSCGTWCGYCCEHDGTGYASTNGIPYPCPDLVDLARHVSAVLSGYTQTAREGQ